MDAPSNASLGARGSCGPWLIRRPSCRMSRSASVSRARRSGTSAAGTKRLACRWLRTHPAMVGPGRFPPLQRVGVEMLACCDPLGLGLHMTHWSMRSLAQVAIERGLAPNIAHSTVSLILRAADLQPHRSRYWKTPTCDD